MNTKLNVNLFKYQSIVVGSAFMLILSSCLNVSNDLRKRTTASTTGTVSAIGQGYVLADNPIILSNNTTLSPDANLSKYLSVATITTDSFLTGMNSCYGTKDVGYCFQVMANDTITTPLQTSTGKWAYSYNTTEFLQVNSQYHVSKILNKFFTDINLGYSLNYSGNIALIDTALPIQSDFKKNDQYNLYITTPLSVYADCDVADNANFSSATNSLCFGYMSSHTNMKWAQDSSAIYHETGHFLQYQMMNLRNPNASSGEKPVRMGNYFYDEAGSLGEGLSDFFSYYVNQRTHFAEWGAGRVLNASRPMSEDDSLHISSLAKESDKRLRYPDFLDYDPNNHTVPTEDIHLSGMIISHFLTAFTEDLVDKCGYSTKDAQSQVLILITETMAELGDLSSKGYTKKGNKNVPDGRINLDPLNAWEWVMKNNPVNYRSFPQTFAKNVLRTLGDATLLRCNGTIYTQDSLETLLDSYGLLNFRTYNENRNFSDPSSASLQNTAVTATNRNNTILIPKNYIQLDPTTGASTAYIIDNQATISAGITSLTKSGVIGTLSDITPSDLGYNNGNGKVSPGEVVAIALNLYNNSNSTMGGVQILANDWKNLSVNGKPCIYTSAYANDYNWTTTSEGGEPCGPDLKDEQSAYRTAMSAASTDMQPICVMQYSDSSSTKWVSQHTFRQKLALDDTSCLSGKGNDKDCFIRAIKGADQANFSKLDPKENWFKTMQDPNSSTAYSLEWGNVMLFEVSKHIPPGTIVDCRFRVRFTNCDDCYHDSTRKNYDYNDVEFNGPRPFKIIHLQMTITD